MKEKRTSGENTKADYQPPQVVRVSLRPEEAVLGHCKVPSSGGPGNSSCKTLFCKTFGS